jgi:hypothetical protein
MSVFRGPWLSAITAALMIAAIVFVPGCPDDDDHPDASADGGSPNVDAAHAGVGSVDGAPDIIDSRQLMLSVTPSQHDFGDVVIPGMGREREFEIRNESDAELPLLDVAVSAGFVLRMNSCAGMAKLPCPAGDSSWLDREREPSWPRPFD